MFKNPLKNIYKMSKKNTGSDEVVNETEILEPKIDGLEQEETKVNSEETSEQQLTELKDKYIRLVAEFDNFKKRSIKERYELIKTASQDTIVSLLPVLDDFDRAKKASDDENAEESFSEGITLVYNKLKNTLNSRGLCVMETKGKSFDPEMHEALTEIPAPSEDLKGKIIDTIEQGYLLNDKIIRYAKVVVGK
jgi:molecular chaperone GrpE